MDSMSPRAQRILLDQPCSNDIDGYFDLAALLSFARPDLQVIERKEGGLRVVSLKKRENLSKDLRQNIYYMVFSSFLDFEISRFSVSHYFGFPIFSFPDFEFPGL